MLSEEEQFSNLISIEKLEKVDAIICLEGDNYARADKARKLFEKDLAPLILISGGLEDSPGSIHARKMKSYLVEKGVPESRIDLEENSKNTHEQAVEVIKIIKERKWRKVILVASEFHQLRAFLTFLKERGDYPVVIFNAPSKKLWSDRSLGESRQSLFLGELVKIKEYQKKGHLASVEEALKYQKWKEKKF